MAFNRRDFFKLGSLAGLVAGLGKLKLPDKKPAPKITVNGCAQIHTPTGRGYSMAQRDPEFVRNQYGEIVAAIYFD